MKEEKVEIKFWLTFDQFIVLRGALNKYQLERFRTSKKIGEKTSDGIEVMKESEIAKSLFNEVDYQWAQHQPINRR